MKRFLLSLAALCCMSTIMMAETSITFVTNGVGNQVTQNDTLPLGDGYLLLEGSTLKMHNVGKLNGHSMHLEITSDMDITIKVEGTNIFTELDDISDDNDALIYVYRDTNVKLTGDTLVLNAKNAPAIYCKSNMGIPAIVIEDMYCLIAKTGNNEAILSDGIANITRSHVMAECGPTFTAIKAKTINPEKVNEVVTGLENKAEYTFIYPGSSKLQINDQPCDPTNGQFTDGVESGAVYYDAINEELVLNNAVLNGDIWYAKWTEDETFSIRVIGKCKLTCTKPGVSAIYCQTNNLEIIGSEKAKLTIEADQSAIRAFHASNACYLDLYGPQIYATSHVGNAIEAKSGNIHIAGFLDAKSLASGKKGISAPDGALNMMGYVTAYNAPQHTIIAPLESIQTVAVSVLGKRINQYNAFDLLEDGSEKVYYDLKKKELWLDNVAITATTGDAVVVETPITLRATNGINTIESNDANGYGLRVKSDMTVGESISQLELYQDILIDTKNADKDITLTFQNANVSTNKIINNGGTNKANVVVNASKMDVDNFYVSSLTLNNCYFENSQNVFRDGKVYDESIEAEAASARIDADAYDIVINNTPVYAWTANDILADGGNFRYNDATKTLYVADGVGFYPNAHSAIEINDQDLNIVFEGDGDIASEGNSTIVGHYTEPHKLNMYVKSGHYADLGCDAPNKPVIDLGTQGELNLNGTGQHVIDQYDGDAKTTPVIIAASTNINAPASIINYDYSATTDVFSQMGKVTLGDVVEIKTAGIQYTAGAPLVNTNSATCLQLEITSKEIPGLEELRVYNYPVTMVNKDDILGDGGSVYFDTDSYHLCLKKAKMDSPINKVAIWSNGSLTIDVYGDCRIRATESTGIYAEKSIAIYGKTPDARLSVVVDAAEASNYYYAIVSRSLMPAGITLEDVAVEAKLINAGIANAAVSCRNGGTTELTLNNADLRASVESNLTSVMSAPELEAIYCGTLNLVGNNLVIRHNAEWNDVAWDAVNGEFTGTERHHIWIGQKEEFPTDVENIFTERTSAEKILRDGQLLIISASHTYNAAGMLIR